MEPSKEEMLMGGSEIVSIAVKRISESWNKRFIDVFCALGIIEDG